MSYHGLDNKLRRTTLIFDPTPERLTTSAAVYELHLEPGETQPLFLAVSCDAPDTRPRPFLPAFIAARRELREATRQQTSVETSNERFNEMLCRSAADLAVLISMARSAAERHSISLKRSLHARPKSAAGSPRAIRAAPQ